jgi:CelD/BcsL family acetyltransferase involved in cellulose biosynthesis
MRHLRFTGRVSGFLRTLAPFGLEISDPHGRDSPTIERDGLVGRCDRAWPQDAEFLEQWAALLARNPDATVFNSPAWQRAITDETFVPAGRLRIVTVRRDNTLLAVFPLALHRFSVLETPGHWVSDYLDPLVDRKAGEQCWHLILDLLNDLWDWSTRGLIFHNILENSPTQAILKTVASKYGFAYQQTVTNCAPYISLPDSWEEYLATLSAKQRRDNRKNLRIAEKDGQARWLTLTTIEETAPALERGLAALRQSEGDKGKFASAFLSGFLQRVAPTLVAQGDFYMHELWLQGKPAAWLFMFRSREGPMLYNSAFDSSLRDWGPGSKCLCMAIRDAIEKKAGNFNFLRGSEDYKFRYGCKSVDLLKISLVRKRSRLPRDSGIFRRQRSAGHHHNSQADQRQKTSACTL